MVSLMPNNSNEIQVAIQIGYIKFFFLSGRLSRLSYKLKEFLRSLKIFQSSTRQEHFSTVVPKFKYDNNNYCHIYSHILSYNNCSRLPNFWFPHSEFDQFNYYLIIFVVSRMSQ